MKGIIIYENDLRAINAVKLKHASFSYKSIEMDITDRLEGTPIICEGANCNKSDTYDFEVGALIALMKMCGREKSLKAVEELYHLYEPKGCDLDGDVLESKAEYVAKENKRLIEENETLKKEKEQIIVAKNVLYNKLEKENEMLKNESMQRLRDKLDLKDKYVALMAENEKLKLDCEKLQHGYIDTDMIFCGGRQNGKQYTFLVELFKKIPKDKVQAAYVVAYKESLIWCTSQPSIRDQLDSLIEENRAFMRKCVDEWLYGPPTKREEMWEKILGVTKCSSVEIKVAKQDITTFLRELQDKIPEVRWNGSDCLPVDLSVPDWFKHDYIYFSLFRNYDKGNLRLCYDDKPHSWVRIKVDYFSPMRWDLFKKGRLIVKVNSDNYEDFYNKCEIEIGRKPFDKYSGTFTVYYKYEKELEEYIFHTRPYKDVIPYAKRVVDWEDVR